MTSPTFQLVAIDPAPFAPLFALSDAELRTHGAIRRVADERPGFPCRVSLQDAEIGEELLLLPYAHQTAASPYRASGPIYVRRGALQRTLGPGEVPDVVARRLISLRAYDADDLMIAATVCDGDRAAAAIDEFFARDAVAYVHLHNAKQGCYSCKAVRA